MIPIGFASRLWINLTPGDVLQRVDNISKRFTGAGWKGLPQELVDEILAYLVDDLYTLKACSLTCKSLFGGVRPLIHGHQRLVCSDTKLEHLEPKRSLFSRHRKDPEAQEQFIDTDRLRLLRYARHLTIKAEDGSLTLKNMQKYLPHLRSITRLHSLTVGTFRLHTIIPIFNKYFVTFTATLQQLDIRNAMCTTPELLYIICQFPMLEDLTIMSPASGIVAPPEGDPALATIKHSPPLRGKLVLVQARSKEFSEGLVALPGGLNFSSLELSWCNHLEAIFAACGHSATSISYLCRGRGVDSEPNLSIQLCDRDITFWDRSKPARLQAKCGARKI